MSDSALRRHAQSGALIAGAHGLALWALLSGLGHQSPELLVPVTAIAQILSPQDSPRAVVAAPAPPAPTRPVPPVLRRSSLVPAPAAASPSPVPAALPPAIPSAPGAPVATPSAAPTASITTSAPATTAAPARVEMPSRSADYLNNPKPAYPPASKRMGEQGLVVVRVLIGADGRAQNAEVRQSSGYERLDQAALATTLRWRYVPGKRAGQAEAMWFNVPIHFVLE